MRQQQNGEFLLLRKKVIATTGGPTASVDLGENCQSASCGTTNSACVTKFDTSRICECQAKYIKIDDTYCQKGPENITGRSEYEFQVSGEIEGAEFVIPFDGLMSNRDLITVSADIITERKHFVLNIGTDGLTLTYTSILMTSSTFAVVLSAVSLDGSFTVQQVISVNITVEDEEFVHQIQALLLTGTRPGTQVVQMRSPRHISRENNLVFGMVSDSDDIESLFHVDGVTGAVTTANHVVLGKDVIAQDYSFNITEIANGGPQKTVATVMVLVVRDDAMVSVEEGYFGDLLLFELSSGAFSISLTDSYPGIEVGGRSVRLNTPRDYQRDERLTEIKLAVNSFNVSDSTSTTLEFSLRITDTNDKPPTFATERTEVFITAGSLRGTIIAVVSAVDPDTVGEVTYSLKGPYASDFQVDKSGAITSLDNLKRSKFGDSFTLEVMASDGINNSENSALVLITLNTLQETIQKDLNMTFMVNVTEHDPVGTYIMNVSAQAANYSGFNFLYPSTNLPFNLNSSTGVVSIKREIDREDRVPHNWLDNLEIVGFDKQDKCNPVQIGKFVVNIIDRNDQKPTFSKTEYEGEVPEETLTDVVVDITLSDGDFGPNADLKVSSNNSKFNISYNGDQVTISPTTPLDREAEANYVLEVKAVDSPVNGDLPLTGSAIVIIRVTDINDQDPVFVNPPTELTITENSGPGRLTTFSATDDDDGVNADIRFSLLSGGLGFLSLQDTGELLATTTVDREEFDRFDLVVRASDKGPFASRRVKDIHVTVKVRDVNDNPPRFDRDVNFFETFEDSDCSSLNAIVKAYDPDEGENGTFRFILNHPKFAINQMTGALSCKSELDHEIETFYTLIVSVVDDGTDPLFSETNVTIKVMDANDNAPLFSNIILEKDLDASDLKTNQFVMLVEVADADSGLNAEVTLSIADPEGKWFKFSSESTGFMQLSRTDIPAGSYSINITATDHGDPPLSSSTSVELRIHDNLPDHSNVEIKTIRFAEGSYSGEIVGSVTTREGNIAYRVSGEPSDVFVVNSTSGQITCTEEVDRETTGQHLLLVNVTYNEGGVERTRRVLVIIDIDDVNDNSPKFVRGPLQVNDVPEDAENNTFVQALSVTDLDSGQNGVAGLRYSIINTDIPFSVDPETGDVSTLGTLDRETQDSYLIRVQVVDGGSPSKSATANISVSLVDVNDNKPTFTQGIYIINVAEKTAVETPLNQEISASDPDYDLNGTVTFNMNSDLDLCPFSLTTEMTSISSRGVLRLVDKLDFETTRLYQCNVSAVDARGCGEGCPYQLRTDATIRVEVLDNNDETPVFQDAPYKANVTRDAVPGNVIIDTIAATDADTDYGNNIISYKILNYQGFFAIGVRTGVLTVKGPLTALQEDRVQIQVEASDNPVSDKPLSATTSIDIDIIDTNNRPWFPYEPYRVDITEEEVTYGSWSMPALDKINEKTVTCNCSYNLLPTEFSILFTIDNAGLVSQVGPLDREQVGSSINLTVEAVDRELPRKLVRAYLFITVLDIDDNLPYFTQRLLEFSVNETVAAGAVIGRLDAVDEDEGDNALIVYSALNMDTRITIQEDGSITVKERLFARQQSIEIITFSVTVENGSLPTGLADVRITIYPYNPNNAPRFERDIYETEVRFLSPRGSSIKLDNFRATDPDSDTLTYTIAAGNTRGIIAMDNTTGSMQLNYELESSIGTLINLTVQATDDYVRPKTGSCLVLITVLNLEPTACVAERQLQIDSEQREIYLGLFIGMAVLLALAFIGAIYTCYKWRAAKSKLSVYKTQYQGTGDNGKGSGDEKPGPSQEHGYCGLDSTKRDEPDDYNRPALLKDFTRGSVHNPGYMKHTKDEQRCEPPIEPIPDYDKTSHLDPDCLSPSMPVASDDMPSGYMPTLQ